MHSIITPQDKNVFMVVVEDDTTATHHSMMVTNAYHRRLTHGNINKEEPLEKSFQFLLEREPKESILQVFNFKDIQNYFPEYEATVQCS